MCKPLFLPREAGASRSISHYFTGEQGRVPDAEVTELKSGSRHGFLTAEVTELKSGSARRFISGNHGPGVPHLDELAHHGADGPGAGVPHLDELAHRGADGPGAGVLQS